MRLNKIVILIVVLAIIAVAAYLATMTNLLDGLRGSTTVTDPQRVNEMVLAYVGTPFPDDYGLLRVPGWVQNNTGETLKGVTVDVQLFNEDGKREEKVSLTVKDIGPRARKSFDVNAGTLPPSRTATISVGSVEVIGR